MSHLLTMRKKESRIPAISALGSRRYQHRHDDDCDVRNDEERCGCQIIWEQEHEGTLGFALMHIFSPAASTEETRINRPAPKKNQVK